MNQKIDSIIVLEELFEDLFAGDPFIELDILRNILNETQDSNELYKLDIEKIDILTYFVIQKRNTMVLNELIKVFQHQDLCLIHAILSDWYEGVLWMDNNYPEAFTTQHNFAALTDLNFYPHQIAFYYFNRQILDWFKENKNSLFYDERLNFCKIADRADTIEKLDWLLNNLPRLLVFSLLEGLMYKPTPKLSLDWFEKNKSEFFPLSIYDCYVLASAALTIEEPELFNQILLLCKETDLTHFQFIIKRWGHNLKLILNAFNIALNDNKDIETISIQYEGTFPDKSDLTNEPICLEISQKLTQNKLRKMWPNLSLILLGMTDIQSPLYEINMDLVVTFYNHLVPLFEEFGSCLLNRELPVNDLSLTF